MYNVGKFTKFDYWDARIYSAYNLKHQHFDFHIEQKLMSNEKKYLFYFYFFTIFIARNIQQNFQLEKKSIFIYKIDE